MNIATNVTAGRTSRLAVSAILAFAYQDSGFESALIGGNLDAAEQVPAGGCFSAPARAARNAVRQHLCSREAGRSYLITARMADGERRYTAIGDAGALMEAAYDAGALGISLMVRP